MALKQLIRKMMKQSETGTERRKTPGVNNQKWSEQSSSPLYSPLHFISCSVMKYYEKKEPL